MTVDKNFEKAVVPLSIVIVFLLFICQRLGTNKVGYFFGPIMGLWFISLAIIGIYHLRREPGKFVSFEGYFLYCKTFHLVNFLSFPVWLIFFVCRCSCCF